MSANVIIFDGLYTADQMRNIDKAKGLVEGAVESLKRASSHEGWKCPESKQVDEGLEILKTRLGRVDQGIMRTGIALGQGMRSFVELEERAANQAEGLSNDLKSKYGFDASTYGQDGGSTTLNVTQVPDYDDGTPISGVNTDNNFGTNGDTPSINLFDVFMQWLQTTLGSIGGAIIGIIKGGLFKIPAIIKAIKDLGTNLVENLGSDFSGLSDEEQKAKIAKILGDTLNDLGELGESLLDAVLYSITGGIKGGLEGGNINTNGIGEDIVEFVEDNYEKGKEVVKVVANEVNAQLPWGE